ncbi:regulator of G-protein signaling 20-like, partial [Tropilaelaps mercedesae]
QQSGGDYLLRRLVRLVDRLHFYFGSPLCPGGRLERSPTGGQVALCSFTRCSSAGRKVFRDYLRCEYSEENILFWLACEELKKNTKEEEVEEKARLIYEDFISILSPREVSLDSRVRDIINKNMVTGPTASAFDEAQLQIYTLMKRDSYPRFVTSPIYRKITEVPATSRKGSAA